MPRLLLVVATPTVTVTETITATSTVTPSPSELQQQNAANLERLTQYLIPAAAVLGFALFALVGLKLRAGGDR